MKKYQNKAAQLKRRESSLERLNTQLEKRTKTAKGIIIPGETQIPLTEKDVKRIKKEILILKDRI